MAIKPMMKTHQFRVTHLSVKRIMKVTNRIQINLTLRMKKMKMTVSIQIKMTSKPIV
jgi:hypothetical protein